MTIKHEAQRLLDEDWVEQIIENWDERGCTPPTVVIENGKNLVVDGQHRIQAMMKLGYKQVECFLIQGIPASQAFIMINNTKPIEEIDKFIQISKISEYENKIYNIFKEYDVDISTISENNFFKNVDYLWQIKNNFNEDALRAALEIIVNVIEFDGLISKNLLSTLYEIFDNHDVYNKVHEEMMSVKHGFLSQYKNNMRKTKTQMQKIYSKSKIENEIKKIARIK